MEIKLEKTCNGCPFRIIEIDYECIGFDTYVYCSLSRFLRLKDASLDAYDSYVSSESPQCDYCKELEPSDWWDNIDETKCKCDEIAEIYQAKVDFERETKESPDWCPLLKEILIINKIKI